MYFVVRFFVFFTFFIIFLIKNNSIIIAGNNDNVIIEKINGMIDWDRQANYEEAKKNLQLAKEIKAEHRRRKQLRQAGVPEDEIKRIINSEREGKILNKHNNMDNDKISNGKTTNINGISDNSIEGDIVYINGKRVNNKSLNDDLSVKNSEENQEYVEEPVRKRKKRYNYEDAEEIDIYSLRPEIPVINTLKNDDEQQIKIDISKNDKLYNDYEVDRMIKKAGENINNKENFLIFASEVGKLANKKINNNETKQDEMLTILEAKRSNKQYYADNSKFNLNNNIDDKKGERIKKNNRFYALADNNINVKKATKKFNKELMKDYSNNKNNNFYSNPNDFNSKKNLKNDEKQQIDNSDYVNKKSTYYASSNNDEIDDDEGQEIIVNNNQLTEKQVQAKNMEAPHPYIRDTKNTKTQYNPQNIAQVSYDKANKHLQPAIFEKNIIKDVFDNLGDDNAIQIAKALINKIGKTDITDDDGNTLLMHAVARQNQSLIAMLLSEGADPNFLNKEGFSPLHLACSNGDNSAIHSLMMGGGNPNLRDKQGNTALMYAVKMGDVNSVKMMISLGGDTMAENKDTGRNVLDFAIENDNPNILSLLYAKNNSLLRKRHPIDITNK